ncbi:MAG TPA: sugar phosphate nucleotidyltransferase [Actinomycetota bacterium]|nr:sugar phosphate nucleotidyltransferase [Actinomycetota bacterium]
MTLPLGEYSGVILAAGRGKRMAPFSERYPKPILPICNRPLIEYHIEIMKALGIVDIVILVGHKGYEITRVLGDGSRLGVSVRYVEQTSALGIANAVGQLERHLRRPFILFLGDIFFVPGDLAEMFAIFRRQGGGGVLAVKEDTPEAVRRNFSVTLSASGLVTKVIEKPRHSSQRLKGVGLYLFDLTIFDAIRRTPRTAMRDEYELTDAIQVMIDDGHPVRVAQSVLDDINLTGPADLLRCNLRHAESCPPEALVGRDTWVNPGASIERSVVGAHVRIKHPIRISHSVVLDNTTVDSTTGFEYCIISPELVVDCRRELVDTGLPPGPDREIR